MNRVLLLSALLLLFTTIGAAAEETDDVIFRGDLESLNLGDKSRVTATIVNELPVQDTIQLTLGGSAVMSGLITVTYDTDPAVRCLNQYTCLVDVPAERQKNVNLTVEATAMGQGVLRGIANSTTTDLASIDTLDVNVGPTYRQTMFSAPGITSLQVLIIALVAGAFIVLRRD